MKYPVTYGPDKSNNLHNIKQPDAPPESVTPPPTPSSGSEQGNVASDATSHNNARPPSDNQPASDRREDAMRFFRTFFPDAGITLDENSTATLVRNARGGLTLQIIPQSNSGHLSQADWTRGTGNYTDEATNLATQSDPQQGAFSGARGERRNLRRMGSSSSDMAEHNDDDASTDSGESADAHPPVYMDSAGVLNITGGNFVAGPGYQYYRP